MGALIGHGSTLTILGPTGTTSVNLPVACLNGDFGSNKVDTHDVTDMSTGGNTRIKIPGLENPGDFAAKYNAKPGDAGQAALAAAKNAGLYDFKFAYPGNVRVRQFTGIIVSIDESVSDDKPATKSLKIEISGPVTDTEASVVAVPQVVGLTQAAATTAITAAGLTVGTVTHQSGSGVTAGDVISTNPVAGVTVLTGSAVALVIES